uniref:Starch-binding domain-containing protein 1 n=1 Tax=Cyprinodon variegatus TaxID=28743 RepID=A0A3Q2DRS7_CYPVA
MANLRNRRVAAENNLQSGLPEREVKPDKLSSASCVEEKPTVPLENEATKSLQDDPCKVKDCNMESATEDKLKEMPCQGEENRYAENNPVCHKENARNLNEGDEKGNKAILESISTDDYLKEQTIDMHESPLPTNNDNIPVTEILINSQPANNLSENMEQHKSLTMPLPTDADAEQVPIIKVAENNLPQLGELSGNHTLLISEKRLEQDFEAKESNTFSPTDKLVESGKRVLTVHPMPQNVNVTFQTHYVTCTPFQKVAVTGNNQELGYWKDFIPLEKAKDGLWATVVSLPAESHVEWKFVVVDRGEVCRWEECGNRLLDTGNRENLLVHKFWGFK